MKNIITIASIAILTLTLAGCGNGNHPKSTVSNKIEHVKKNHPTKKSSSKKTEDNSKSNLSSSRSSQSSSSQSKKVAASSDLQTLTDFVNKYGMSPAAYKMKHGMSEKQALASTPRNMKTSGEIQEEYVLNHPDQYNNTQSQDTDPNGLPVNSDNDGDGFDDQRESDNANALSDYVKTHHQTDFK